MSKLKIIDRRSEASIKGERNLLANLNHPFIVNMYFAFQDFYNLYLVMDLLTGGDLRYHIAYKKTFTEDETKFFISNMILALEYIHSKNILHRDIKPENLVLEKSGYLRITDFGVAKINEKDNSSETSGTPGYMAPEVILVLNHSFPSDFFALGIIGYEFMKGYRPYLGRSRKEIKQLILNKQAKIKKDEIPENWSLNAVDFINKLLIRKGDKRLGHSGIIELKTHPWMEDIDWELLSQKKIKPPFVPNRSENYDKKYCEGEDEIGEETIERYQIYAQNDLYPDVFKNYTFCNLSYISNYHIKRLKRFKESNINIKDIIEKNVNKVLKEENNSMNSMNNIKKINEKENKNESINSSVKINKNNSEIINDKNKSKYKINKSGKIKNHSKSVEDLKQYNINNNTNSDNKETKEEIIASKNPKNKNNKFNKKKNYNTIDTNRINSKIKRKKISLSKEKANYDYIKKNFKENIIYNNYINLHFNDFSTNKNYNNSNNINIESNSSNNKKISSKLSSNITNKTKSKINNIIPKNKIVKSSSMKLLENVGNKNLFEEILSQKNKNKNNHNKHINTKQKLEKNNIKTINHVKLDNFRNAKKIIDNKVEIKTAKNKNTFNLNLAKKINKKVKNIFNKKLNLLMDIIYNNSNDINNINNVNSNVTRPKRTENIININRIGKCHSSCGFYTNAKTMTINKKKNINLKFAKKHRNLSMQNISNNEYNDIYNNKNISNYNTLNLNQNSKNNIGISNKNNKYTTFYSLNNTTKCRNKIKKASKNKIDIKNILNSKKSLHILDEKYLINKKSFNKSKSRHKSSSIHKNL